MNIRTWGVIALTIVLLLSVQTSAFGKTDSNDQKYYFDKHYKVDDDKGFSLDEKEKIKDNDPHYGWNLGSLYVSGYTQRTTGEDGNQVFLKNAGDSVVLGFQLDQDIDKLNGNEDLSIGIDKKGFDSYFEVSKTNFGRGTLIVQHTDYQNSKEKPQVYTNYLSAESEINANTVVELNEEGDYEVALDYVIKEDPRNLFGKSILPKYSDYTIRLFKFSVRNGNSMVFPFDSQTGEELSNKSFTPNGFRIDLAKSHYLKVFVKKELLDGEETSDTRLNRPAKDGDVFTDEGLYTITVQDPSTDQETTKVIYVGTDERYKAYVTTGLSLDDIDNQLAQGASIADDGTIVAVGTKTNSEKAVPLPASDKESNDSGFPIILVLIIVVLVVIAFIFIRRRGKKKSFTEVEKENQETEEL